MRSRFSASREQQQVGVAARADEREGLQQVVGGEVLAGGEELALVGRPRASASSRRQAGSTFRNVYLTKWRSGMAGILRWRIDGGWPHSGSGDAGG